MENKTIITYGVMFGSFAPILKKDFDIARKIMKLKNLDGIVFVPDSHSYGRYGVNPDDKPVLIRIAAQDYVNATKEDAAYMVSTSRLNDGGTVAASMMKLAKEVIETNTKTNYYIKHIPLVDVDNKHEGDSWEGVEHITYSKKKTPDSNIVDVSDIENVDLTIYKIHDILEKEGKIPESYMTGSGHAYFYLKACINWD